MKIAFYAIVFVLVISGIWVSGCSTPAVPLHPENTPVAITGTHTIPTTALSPEMAVTPGLNANSSVRRSTAPTKISINKHFLTIAFSEYNGVVLRQERNLPITIEFFGRFSPEDLALIQQFIQDFNRISKTQKFSVNIRSGNEADLWINLFPGTQLQSIQKNSKGMDQMQYTEYDSMFSDNILFSVNFTEQIFINSDLPTLQRQHYLLRAITFWLGITGDATDEESFFYPGNAEQVNLTESDWKALMILYGPTIRNNLTVSDVKNRMWLG